jgi:fimbrial isopeptide formation D2 family protein/uncharacterized repeat protein (TIGR01451 family)
MKTKIGICLVMVLLLVASSLSAVNIMQANSNNIDTMPITVIKKVWDGNHWADEADADFGDVVRFNITVTYYPNTPEGLLANEIVVIDTLPENYIYNDSANFEPSSIVGNVITWNLSTDYGIVLEFNQSVSVEFDAIALNYGISINTAESTAFELCCDWALYGIDNATVNVGEPLVLLKEVFDPDTNQWVENLTSYVKKSVPLKFRITVTYNGYFDVELMKCMSVEDFLPDCCLEYLGNEIYTYPDTDLFDNPVVTVSPDKKYVKYDWTNKRFNLYAGQSISIEFEASVVYYCYETVENCAYVEVYNCLNCPNPVILTASDCASIYCYPPDYMIEKKVLDNETNEWAEETTVFVGDTVTFKIDVTYYGNYNLTDISILDQLHPSMEFTGISTVPPTAVDGNLIWWNFTGPLNDSETISIEFDAKAIAGTGAAPGINNAFVTGYENGILKDDSDTAGVIVKTNIAPCAPDVKGDESGVTNQVLTYYATACDPDGNNIYYMFDWGDGTFSEWLGPYVTCQQVQATHSWSNAGTYNVKAKAKDDPIGFESAWSHYPVVVKITVPPVLSLDVTIKRGLAFSVSVNILNDGEAELNNIQWTLKVDRMGLIKRTLFNDSGTIPSLDVAEIEKLTGTPRGIGLVRVTVQVDSPDIDPIEVTANGFIFMRLIFLTQA